MGMLLLAFALLAARVVASENLTGANLLRVRVTSDCQTHFLCHLLVYCELIAHILS